MREAAPQPEQSAEQFAYIDQQQYANGVMHLYGVNEVGKKTHLSYEKVAAVHGREVGNNSLEEEPAAGEPKRPRHKPEDFLIQPLPYDEKTEPHKVYPKTEDETTTGIRENGQQKRLSSEQQVQLDERRGELKTSLDDTRSDYLRRVAERSRRSMHLNSAYSEKSIEKARKAYLNAETAMAGFERGTLRGYGSAEEVHETLDVMIAFGEQHRLAKNLRDARLIATGNYRLTKPGEKDANGDPVQTTVVATEKGIVGRQMHKFYDWHGRLNEGGKWYSKGALKKAGAMAGVGAVVGAGVGLVGIVAAPLTGAAFAGVGGAIAANRIAKAYMSAHVRSRSEQAKHTYGGAQARELRARFKNEFKSRDESVNMTDLITGNTKREVTRNRRRAALATGVAALGGAVGAGLLSGSISFGVDKLEDSIGNLPFIGHWGNGSGAVDGKGNWGEKVGDALTHKNSGPDAPKNLDAKPGLINGFKQRVYVEHGHGFVRELQDSMHQRGSDISGEQGTALYNHLVKKFPNMHGNFFTTDPSYVRAQGDFGISRAGWTKWNPRVLAEVNRYAEEHDLLKKTA